MFKITREEIDWGGRPLVLETGRIARQADGAVLATYGETSVLATVVADRSPKPGLDFFPLTVNYQEKAYAAGKVPGGYFKREGRPSEKETLVSRLIDRPIRPLFVKGFKNETQVIATVMSHDLENDADIVALVAVSAALTISGIPFQGPIGAARVGFIDGEYVLNPTLDQMAESDLDLVVAGTDDAVLMVESEANELPEDVMLGAVMHGHKGFQPVIEACIRMAEQAAKEPRVVPESDDSELKAKVADLVQAGLQEAYQQADKQTRQAAIAELRDKVNAELVSEDASPDERIAVSSAFKSVESNIVRGGILDTSKRIDGRGLADVRQIVAEAGVLPRTHGSALFTRGETQALVVATLGTGDDEQFVDALEGTYRENFMLHYNFPPYSVGETGRVGFTGRREIGHGKLAWRSLKAMLPSKEEFPYTLRLVSEITESNGSSSMATVCGSSLAMMDAGVPLKKPVAGIAMGLIKEGDRFAVLSDILGDEDHLGDMDFKVAGTEKGITSLQLDIKVSGLSEKILKEALGQAKVGRQHILSRMLTVIDASRGVVSPSAPKIEHIMVDPEKVGLIIGPGGKMIRKIEEESGASVTVSDGTAGQVCISAVNQDSLNTAKRMILSLTKSVEAGEQYTGRVTKIMAFGAFIEVLPGKEGLMHISTMTNKRLSSVDDVLSVGQVLEVRVREIDGQNRINLVPVTALDA